MNNLLGNKNNNKVTQINRNKYSDLKGIINSNELNKIIKFQKDSGQPVDSYFKNQESHDVNKMLKEVNKYKTTLDEFPMTLRDGLRDGTIEKSIIDISKLTQIKGGRSVILQNLMKYPDVNKKIDLSLLYFGNHLDLFEYFDKTYISGNVVPTEFILRYKDIEEYNPSEKNTENDESNINELILDYFNMGNNYGIKCKTKKSEQTQKLESFNELNENDYELTNKYLTDGFKNAQYIFKKGNLLGILLRKYSGNKIKGRPFIWDKGNNNGTTNNTQPNNKTSNNVSLEGGVYGNKKNILYGGQEHGTGRGRGSGRGNGRWRGRGRNRGSGRGSGRGSNRGSTNNNSNSTNSGNSKKNNNSTVTLKRIIRIGNEKLTLYDKDYKKDKDSFKELDFKFNSENTSELVSSKIIYDKVENMPKMIDFLKSVLRDSMIKVNINKLDDYSALKDFIIKKQMDIYFNNKDIDLTKDTPETLKNAKLKGETNYGLSINNSYTLPSTYINVLKDLYPTLYETIEPEQRDTDLPLNYLITLFIDKSVGESGNQSGGDNSKNINKYIDSLIKKSIDGLFYNYINNLVYDYHTKDIDINVKKLKENTKQMIEKYMGLLKDILYNLESIIKEVLNKTNSNKNDKIVKEIIKEIKNKYKEEVKKADLSLGILISVLYEYDKKHPFNVPDINDESLYSQDLSKYLNDNDITLSELVTQGSFNNGEAIYYSPSKKKFIVNEIMGSKEDEKDRLVMTKQNLKILNKKYNEDVCEMFNKLKKMYESYEVKKIKYLMIVSWLIEKNQKNKIVEMGKIIKKEFNNYLKKVSGVLGQGSNNSQSNPLILRISKSYFSQIIYNLQNTLLQIIGSKNKLGNVVKDYNDYIEKYSLWVLYILDSLGTFSDNKQEIIFESIFSIFLNKKVIDKWVDGCKKTRLNFYLPIKTKDKQQFINLVTGRRLSSGNKSKLNNFVIVKPRSFNDGQGYFYWESKVTRLGKDPYDIISTVLRNYLKSVKSINMTNSKSFFMKSINGLCSSPDNNYSYNQNDVLKEKMNIIKSNNNLSSLQSKIDSINQAVSKSKSLKQNCKNFISLEQLIQEIIKYKYPLDISPLSVINKNQNKVKKLDSLVRKEQKRLVKIIQNRNKNI